MTSLALVGSPVVPLVGLAVDVVPADEWALSSEVRKSPNSLVEIWQADASGRYASPADPNAPANAAFKGFGRAPTTKAAPSAANSSAVARPMPELAPVMIAVLPAKRPIVVPPCCGRLTMGPVCRSD